MADRAYWQLEIGGGLTEEQWRRIRELFSAQVGENLEDCIAEKEGVPLLTLEAFPAGGVDEELLDYLVEEGIPFEAVIDSGPGIPPRKILFDDEWDEDKTFLLDGDGGEVVVPTDTVQCAIRCVAIGNSGEAVTRLKESLPPEDWQLPPVFKKKSMSARIVVVCEGGRVIQVVSDAAVEQEDVLVVERDVTGVRNLDRKRDPDGFDCVTYTVKAVQDADYYTEAFDNLGK